VTLLVPIEAGMAIVVWIGIIIVAQAFSATPDRHAPAVAVGILPGIAAWGVFMLKQGLRAAGTGSPAGPPFGPAVEDALALLDVSARGAFALEQGALVTAMILSAVTVEIIERRFRTAAVWCAVAAALSWVGMLHAYGWTQGDTVVDLRWGAGAPWTAGYLGAAAFLVVVPWVTRSRD
jgi:AGZA family xanthine/uracil permease-like MFS transporter